LERVHSASARSAAQNGTETDVVAAASTARTSRQSERARESERERDSTLFSGFVLSFVS